MWLTAPAAMAMTKAMITTTDEWPKAKNSPVPSGLCPWPISLRVTLSMAAMWSASTPWRSPRP